MVAREPAKEPLAINVDGNMVGVAAGTAVALVALRRGRHPGLHTTGQGRGPPTTRAVG